MLSRLFYEHTLQAPLARDKSFSVTHCTRTYLRELTLNHLKRVPLLFMDARPSRDQSIAEVFSSTLQALLDMYTIRREVGRIDDLNIAMVGDLLNGRTVHSLAYMLAAQTNVRMWFVAPEVVKMRPDVLKFMRGT